MKMEFSQWLNIDKVLGIFRSGGSENRRIASIGMFDGVHRGHLSLIEFLKEEGARRGLTPTAVTFEDHPLRVVRPADAPPLLTTLDQKMELLRQTGVCDCVVLDFNESLRRQSARQFLERLRRDYNVAALVIGFNHHVGSDRVAGIDAYRAIGSETGLEVIAAPEFRYHGRQVSSSVVRGLLDSGDLDQANDLLGRNFAIEGTVVSGRKLGRTIGFPTANVAPVSPSQLIPQAGVYAAVTVTPDGVRRPAMVNVGYRPTVSGSDDSPTLSIEANIFDYLGFLYGETIVVEFVKFMRREKKFSSVERLKSAIAADETHIRQFFEKNPVVK